MCLELALFISIISIIASLPHGHGAVYSYMKMQDQSTLKMLKPCMIKRNPAELRDVFLPPQQRRLLPHLIWLDRSDCTAEDLESILTMREVSLATV